MNRKANKVFTYIINHRRQVTIFLLVLALLLMIIPQFFLDPDELARNPRIETLYFCSQITSSLFVIFGVIVAVWQYYLSSTKKINEMNYARIERAIELSNYYKDNILKKYSVVKKVFKEYGITEMMERKRSSVELKNFDVIELNQIFSREEQELFGKIFRDKEFIKILVKLNQNYNVELKGATKIHSASPSDGTMTVEVAVNPNELINDFYATYITETLNNAEYFAMAFTHNTADASVIYQSIYPTYLEMCYVMYYFIAKYSDPSVCKLYTNVAELYCMWRGEETKQKATIASSARCAGKQIGTVLSDS